MNYRATLAVLPFLLAACGGEDASGSAPSETSSETASTPATDTAAPTASTEETKPAEAPSYDGRVLFNACAVCHTAQEGAPSRVGPNLYGVVGRDAGSRDDFAYSTAMREASIVWTEDNLNQFLENPQKFIRGNRMAYAGERNADKRAAIIDYLKSLSAD